MAILPMLVVFVLTIVSAFPAVQATTIAFCSDPGCMVINSSHQAIPDIGVRLAASAESDINQAWLLPGTYKKNTPELSGKTNVLEPFFSDPDIHRGQGFDIDIQSDEIIVSMSDDASLLAYGDNNFQGGSNNKDKKLKSYIVRTDVAAVVDVEGGSVDSLQLWDGLPSASLFGMGNATLTLSKLMKASDMNGSSTYCPRSQFMDGEGCTQCHQDCATCWKASFDGCLSCSLDKRLYGGICYPNFCAGGAYQISGLGLCLEDLLFLDLDTSAGSSGRFDDTTVDLKVLLPAVGGGVLFLGLIGAICLYRRRKLQHTRSLLRENLSSWTSKQKIDSMVSGANSQNDYKGCPSSAQLTHTYADPAYYEMDPYMSPPHKGASTSPGSTYLSEPTYSVPPFSEGGPTVEDDWDAREAALQARIEKELARRRLEIKAVAALERKRSRESPPARTRQSPSLRSPTEVAGDYEEELMTPRTLAKSVPFTPLTERAATPSPPPPKTKTVTSPERKGHRKDPSIEKIDSWRKRNTRPDPVPPAETIVSSAPLQTPTTSRSGGSKIDRITEWIQTPKDSPARPETILEPRSGHGHHSRKGSQESSRSGTRHSRKESQESGGSSRRHDRKGSRDLPPPPSAPDDTASDALTSISRNAAKQATLKARRAEILQRVKEDPEPVSGPSSSLAPTGKNSAAQVLLESMSELLDDDSALRSFR